MKCVPRTYAMYFSSASRCFSDLGLSLIISVIRIIAQSAFIEKDDSTNVQGLRMMRGM
jgi:hypothetical protein